MKYQIKGKKASNTSDSIHRHKGIKMIEVHLHRQVDIVSMVICLVSLGYANQLHRIVNGKYATPGQFPHTVSWCYYDLDWVSVYPNRCIHFCGGSILNTTTIITAAHCCEGFGKPDENNDIFYWSDTVIVAGDFNLVDKSGFEQVKKIKSHIIHPHYRHLLNQNDICLLTLKSPLEFNQYVDKIDIGEKKPVVGTKCQVSGWGRMWVSAY